MHSATDRRGHRRARLRFFCICTATLLLSGVSALPPAPADAAPPATTAVCGPAAPGTASCLAVKLNDPSAWRGKHKGAAKSGSTVINGYTPTDLASAYNLPSGGGTNETVAIVDAYDDPNAASDLIVYRSTMNLPPCGNATGTGTGAGCLTKVDENGGTNYPHGSSSWAGEISLDVDMVSAICPNCHILLVEASSSSNGDLGAAVDTAVGMGAVAVSNSYGAPEVQSDGGLDAHYTHPGVAITVASGDNKDQVDYPASSPGVTAVGGTTLSRTTGGRGWTETAWRDAASGCSSYLTRPTWQTDAFDPLCQMRTVADVSAVADPATGVALYDTYGAKGWLVFGGTSVSSPIIASIYALAGNTSSVAGANLPYNNTSDLYDVTSGGSGKCKTYLCTAGPGYDGPTGLGTPNGLGAF